MASLRVLECEYFTAGRVAELKSNSEPANTIPVPRPHVFLFELCAVIVKGELPLTQLRLALESAQLPAPPTPEWSCASIIADTIAHLAQEVSVSGEQRARLVELAKWVVHSELVPPNMLLERCEEDFLHEAEMVKLDPVEWKKKEVRVNTRIMYTQTKFNLLREESEGYAKLVTLLNQGLSEREAESCIKAVKSLIGHFDLDPNRVLDIILESFQSQLSNAAFLHLIPLFPKAHAVHILGFKFQAYQGEGGPEAPLTLYRLAAALIKHALIDLPDIYAHLTPTDSAAVEEERVAMQARIREATQIGKVNLAAVGADLPLEEPAAADVGVDLLAAVHKEQLLSRQGRGRNQKLGLLQGMLEEEDWPHARLLLHRLTALHPTGVAPISAALRRNIDRAIAPGCRQWRPAYLAKNRVPSAAQGGGEDSEMGEVWRGMGPDTVEMIAALGPYLFKDAILFQKICLLLRVEMELGGAEERRKAVAVTECALLPALHLMPANHPASLALWRLLDKFSMETRFRLYGEWDKGEKEEQPPMLVAARQMAQLDTRRMLKRLAKDNLRVIGRMLAKLAHCSPLVVFRCIVVQVEAYKDLIGPVIDSLKYCNQFELDVLEYVVLERLGGGGRRKVKEDGMRPAEWLQNLAAFWGALGKKYPQLDLRGLISYLLAQLKVSEGMELIVLQEMVQQMGGVEFVEALTQDQREALAGGEVLRAQALTGRAAKAGLLTKPMLRLKEALLPAREELRLAIPLLVAIAHYRSNVIVSAEAPHIKLMSDHFDRTHAILMEYSEFLPQALQPPPAYAKLLPPLDALLHNYHLEPEVAFHLYRPILRSFRVSREADASWPMLNSSTALLGSAEGDDPGLYLEPNGPPAVKWSGLLTVVRTCLSPPVWTALSPHLYLTFWGLQLADLDMPTAAYEAEGRKVRALQAALDHAGDNSSQAVQKRKKEKERLQEVLRQLEAEQPVQMRQVAAVKERLGLESQKWMEGGLSKWELHKTTPFVFVYCLIPRALLSTQDAMYSARFFLRLHELSTPFYNIVASIDFFICKHLLPLLCSCTEAEAARLGCFLAEILRMTAPWAQESVYSVECWGKPGFMKSFSPTSECMTYEQYQKILAKWQLKMVKVLCAALESSEYIDIRNALQLLNLVVAYFPSTRRGGLQLEKRVLNLRKEERKDLKLMAMGVAAALAARKSSWVKDKDPPPRQATPELPAPAPSAPLKPAALKGPQAEGEGGAAPTPLRAEAHPFVPAKEGLQAGVGGKSGEKKGREGQSEEKVKAMPAMPAMLATAKATAETGGSKVGTPPGTKAKVEEKKLPPSEVSLGRSAGGKGARGGVQDVKSEAGVPVQIGRSHANAEKKVPTPPPSEEGEEGVRGGRPGERVVWKGEEERVSRGESEGEEKKRSAEEEGGERGSKRIRKEEGGVAEPGEVVSGGIDRSRGGAGVRGEERAIRSAAGEVDRGASRHPTTGARGMGPAPAPAPALASAPAPAPAPAPGLGSGLGDKEGEMWGGDSGGPSRAMTGRMGDRESANGTQPLKGPSKHAEMMAMREERFKREEKMMKDGRRAPPIPNTHGPPYVRTPPLPPTSGEVGRRGKERSGFSSPKEREREEDSGAEQRRGSVDRGDREEGLGGAYTRKAGGIRKDEERGIKTRPKRPSREVSLDDPEQLRAEVAALEAREAMHAKRRKLKREEHVGKGGGPSELLGPQGAGGVALPPPPFKGGEVRDERRRLEGAGPGGVQRGGVRGYEERMGGIRGREKDVRGARDADHGGGGYRDDSGGSDKAKRMRRKEM